MGEYEFKTRNGVVISTQPFKNYNMVYSTAMAVFLGPSRPEFSRGLLDYEPVSGMLSRRDDAPENTSVDCYLAACCSSEFAHRFLKRWRRGGYFNCEPGFKIKYLKQLFWFRPAFWGIWAHAKVSAGERMHWFARLVWVFAIRLAARKPVTNQDGWIQSALMIGIYRRCGWRDRKMDEACAHYFRNQPAPFWRIMADYIGTEHHPLVHAWKENAHFNYVRI